MERPAELFDQTLLLLGAHSPSVCVKYILSGRMNVHVSKTFVTSIVRITCHIKTGGAVSTEINSTAY